MVPCSFPRAASRRALSTVPEFVSLNIDGLGKGRRGPSMIAGRTDVAGYQRSVRNSGGALHVEYRVDAASADSPPSWTFDLAGDRIVLTTNWSGEFEPAPFVFHFNLNQVHSTALGLFQVGRPFAQARAAAFSRTGIDAPDFECAEVGLTYTSDRPHQAATLFLPGEFCASAHHVHVRHHGDPSPASGIADDRVLTRFAALAGYAATQS